jgi:N-acetylneuraminic acid mutarotase
MSPDSMSTGWYYSKQGAPPGRQTGPLTWEQLYGLARSGALTPADLVWNQALPRWLPAGQIGGLFPGPAGYGAAPGPAYRQGGYPPGGRRNSWLYWVIPLVALILVGGGLGAYFGLRDGDGDGGSTTTIKSTTTTSVAGSTTTASSTTTTTTASTSTTVVLVPNTWVQLSSFSATAPPARESHAMIYDPITAQSILFGGWNDQGDYNDTWAFDSLTETWTELTPSSAPAARAYHSMVYDPVGGRAILFGGADDSGTYFEDTWAYDPVADDWAELSPSGGPSARDAHAMAFDSTDGWVILFGGWDDNANFNDTWAYDPVFNTWTDMNPFGGAPSPRDSHAMAYDPSTDRVILFGGYDGQTRFADTWAYDPIKNKWTELRPAGAVPPGRSGHKMVYDSNTGKIVMFGGYDGNFGLGDTWEYDPAKNTWTELDPAGDWPDPRDMFAMVYDSGTSKVILFGGYNDESDLNDTWGFGRFLPLS